MKQRDHLLSQCGGCGAAERFLLHNVRHRATYRRLCTNCLLKNHQGLFCPFCFHVYEDSLPPHHRLVCLKCPSISHLSCVPSSYSHSPPSFLCPSCSSPNFSFFHLNTSYSSPTHKRIKPPPTLSPTAPHVHIHPDAAAVHSYSRVIDKDSARALVAAAKIAAVSMTKAAAVARVEAERRVKEAALAKKRAREALERLAYLAAREKEMKEKDEQQKVDNTHSEPIQADDGGVMGKEHTRNGPMAVQREGK